MGNREPDGRSAVVDYAKLGPARVRALLASGQHGWTPHQVTLAYEWLASHDEDTGAESAKVARAGLRVGLLTFWATVFSVLIAVVIGYLALKK